MKIKMAVLLTALMGISSSQVRADSEIEMDYRYNAKTNHAWIYRYWVESGNDGEASEYHSVNVEVKGLTYDVKLKQFFYNGVACTYPRGRFSSAVFGTKQTGNCVFNFNR